MVAGRICASLLIALSSWPVWAGRLAAESFPLLPSADIHGRTTTVEQLRGRVTAVVVCGQASERESIVVSRELVAAMNQDRDRYAFVLVIDLATVPEMARGITTGIVRDRLAAAERDIDRHLQQRGQKMLPGVNLSLPDWTGQAVHGWLGRVNEPEYAVFQEATVRTGRFERDRTQREQQRLKSQVQVFVLDRSMAIRAHFAGVGAGGRAVEAMRSLATGL